MQAMETGRYEAAGGAANVNMGLDRERESTIYNLEDKKGKKPQHFYLLGSGLLSQSFLSCRDFKMNDLYHWHDPPDAVGLHTLLHMACRHKSITSV